MVASLNAFMKIKGANGESIQDGAEGWIELQSWEWEVEADTTWTKGGGASVGKPSPSKLSWEHYWDTSSSKLLGFICTGSSFESAELRMYKNVNSAQIRDHRSNNDSSQARVVFWTATMGQIFITKVNQSATEEGNVTQKVEMVFKEVEIHYRRQKNDGTLDIADTYKWDIPGGSAEPGG